MWCDPICFSYLFLIFMGLKWFTTSWNQKYSPQILWEHHFRPIKMDHSQLYRGENITTNKDINDMCWYQWVIMGILFESISTFEVFWGWMCLFLIFMGLKWFTTSWNQKYSPQILWEHHFRPIKMDHSQLYRGENITINKDINDMCWYQWVIMGIWFERISTFEVFWSWMCLFLIFMGLKWFTTSWNQKYSPQILWEHHFRPIKMDHSQLYRGENITTNKDINDMCWYQWVIMGKSTI